MGLLDATQQSYHDGNNHGNYQFTSLTDIINQFIVAYVGENKIIRKIERTDVAFHAQRALQELSFDTFKSCKAQEITVPASLQMILPQDYVNYTKISWVDSAGIKHLLYPTSKTSNPTNPIQDADGDFILQSISAVGTLVSGANTVALDAEYKNIEVGMKVTGPYIPNGTFVEATSNASEITTVTLHDGSGTDVSPLIPGTITDIGNTGTTLTFTTPDASLIHHEDSAHIVDNLSWGIGDITFNYKITGTASELTNIKIGMLVSHDNFPPGTKVTNVFDTTIVVSHIPDNIAYEIHLYIASSANL